MRVIKNAARVFLIFMLLCAHVYAEISYSPYVDKTHPNNVYWGDTHVHTNMSIDANGLGNRNLTPTDAFRFAKGEQITAHNGQPVKLRRALDFMVVADHASRMGIMPKLVQADPDLLKTDLGKDWYKRLTQTPFSTKEVLNAPDRQPLIDAFKSIISGPHSFIWNWNESQESEETRRSVWTEVTKNADQHNEPGYFTAFIGYEWTASLGGSIHRVVIFKDDASKAGQVLPLSSYDTNNPEDLWAYFNAYEKKTGGQVLGIPHNSNLSGGTEFALTDSGGQPMSQEYAMKRNRWEPLLEVTQMKGDSEAHPALSPTDEFADYETWNSWNGWSMDGIKDKNWKSLKQHEYARSGLKLGLQQRATLGVNPFKFGMIGSTDAHTSLATADEDNFLGKMSLLEPSKYRAASRWQWFGDSPQGSWEFAASGYAAVWAEENTREALFAAMKRKEVYASTGPRITVRFFGGWDYQSDDAFSPDLARIGYQKGVPMGGDLTNAPKGKSPRFLIRAVKDPDGANLDRVQVIKGWHDANGELHEKIYDVALSDSRKPNWRGKVKPVGNTVDIPNASYTNSIGDPELAVVWHDPDFNKDELAFYYLRVLEIPTPRWTAYDAKYFKLKDIPAEVPMVTQERAYTSPIWYSPVETRQE